MSGPNATYGELAVAGASLAAEHINADNMLRGKLSLQYEDSQGLPQQGVIAVNKLISVTKVPYFLTMFTGVSKAIAPVANRAKVVAVNGSAVGPDLAELGPYFWNTMPLANLEVKAMVSYLTKQKNLKMALVYVDDGVGQAIKKELERELPLAGATLVEAMAVPVTAQQFSSVAAKMRAAEPDVIYIASYGAQQAQIIKQFRDNGLKQQLASYSAFTIPETNAQVEAIGSVYTSQSIDWKSNSDPVTKRFVEDYEKKYKKLPGAYIANYYNAVRLFGLLAQKLVEKGKPITGENLLAQRLETKTFDLVGGKITINDNGTISLPMQITEIDGKTGKVVASGLK